MWHCVFQKIGNNVSSFKVEAASSHKKLVTLMQIKVKPVKFFVAETGCDLNVQFTLKLDIHQQMHYLLNLEKFNFKLKFT
jgi:hypothetical protein